MNKGKKELIAAIISVMFLAFIMFAPIISTCLHFDGEKFIWNCCYKQK